MKLLKLNKIFAFVLLGLVLIACSNSSQPSNNSANPSPSTESRESSSPDTEVTSSEPAKEHSAVSQGGQVVEVGDYHLELKTLTQEQETHLDFYLQKGNNHEPVPNAQVTGQVQFPDGTEKKLNFTYDEKGKHYVASLPKKVAGKYQLKMTAAIEGKPVNGRFSFE